MLEGLLDEILRESRKGGVEVVSEQVFVEMVLNCIYQFLYKCGLPVHTVGVGILRGSTFDMYYRGRIVERYARLFGAMSYDTTLAGRACELFKREGRSFLHLFSRERIREEFEVASRELGEVGLGEDAEALVRRAETTIDQGVGSFLLMPLFFGGEVVGIFTLSSLKESDEGSFLGEDIGGCFVPVAQVLSLMLYLEKISYEKAEEMGRLLISSVDGKDEYQATHSLDVRVMIDMFIDELSRDRELRDRVEGIGFSLTVDGIERLRLAALLHDMGKVFVPSSILQKGDLTKEEILIRKMHSYCTYNILSRSKTLGDIADIASMHHALYFIPTETKDLDMYTRIETKYAGYPFDRVGQRFVPESQIIALADTFNAIIRARPDRKGLSISQALDIIESIDYKFHGGLKDIFLTVVRRVERNLVEGKYPAEVAEVYRRCLWLEGSGGKKVGVRGRWSGLYRFLGKVDFNSMGIVGVMGWGDAGFLVDEGVMLGDKPVELMVVEGRHVVVSVRDIPKEEGFIWIDALCDYLKGRSFGGKIAFAFVGRHGRLAGLEEVYGVLVDGLEVIANEPVHYYLHPDMYRIK
jgi:HD-GYP domain-containing protein (c-di-GMP phosphodiesterase class II)